MLRGTWEMCTYLLDFAWFILNVPPLSLGLSWTKPNFMLQRVSRATAVPCTSAAVCDPHVKQQSICYMNSCNNLVLHCPISRWYDCLENILINVSPTDITVSFAPCAFPFMFMLGKLFIENNRIQVLGPFLMRQDELYGRDELLLPVVKPYKPVVRRQAGCALTIWSLFALHYIQIYFNLHESRQSTVFIK